jgi:hypothetical protein
MGNNQENDKPIVFKITNYMIKNISWFTLIVLIIAIGFISSYWLWNWKILETIATWLLGAGVVAAIVQIADNRYRAEEQAKQARKSTDEARKSTNAQIAMELFRELRAEKAIEKMRSVYKIESHAKYLSESEKNDVDYILDRLDTLGNLVKMNIIDEILAFETYGGPPALRFWYKIKEYIRKVQKERGYYGENFEGFVRASIEYFTNNKIMVNYYYKGQEDKPINLISELKKTENLPRSWEEIEKERKNKKMQGV